MIGPRYFVVLTLSHFYNRWQMQCTAVPELNVLFLIRIPALSDFEILGLQGNYTLMDPFCGINILTKF